MKLLYVVHTDWDWIKQRSQFLAENLACHGCDVHVVYKYSLKRKQLVKNSTALKTLPFLFLPFSIRTISFLSLLDLFLWRVVFKILIKLHKFDKIIITHPLLIDYVKDMDVPIIYDCHDDNAEFYSDGKLKALLKKKHNETLQCASQTIFSSQHLMSKYSIGSNDKAVRNGHNFSPDYLLQRLSKSSSTNNKDFNVFYFGTISEWFDNELLLDLVDAVPNIFFTVIGPTDVTMRKHEKIKYLGAMKHEILIEYAEKADAFVMPFRLNELIYGVDPVKIYEYLSYPVPVISVYYPELNHFGQHVEFYRTSEQAVDLFVRLLDSPGEFEVDMTDRLDFLLKSSWESRALEFKVAISE